MQAAASDVWTKGEPLLLKGLPSSWEILRLAQETEVNGMPILVLQFGTNESLKSTATTVAEIWSKDGWKIETSSQGLEVQITAVQYPWMKRAAFNTADNKKTTGYLSLSDVPRRFEEDSDKPAAEFGKHLHKPTGTVVLNEVRTLDDVGEALMTTLVNTYDLEQNAAFYEDNMAASGWKVAARYAPINNESRVLKFMRNRTEATFTLNRKDRRTFIVVNWVTK